MVVDGKVVTWLNGNLIKDQEISEETLRKIMLSHGLKHILADRINATDDPRLLAYLGDMWTSLLFYQQKLWGLPRAEASHNWSEIPKCCCHVMNPYDEKIGPNVSIKCPLHKHRIF